MSKDAIQAVLNELEFLPEIDQRRVLDFLGRLKRQHPEPSAHNGAGTENSALSAKGNLLVFTGELTAPDADWVELRRGERDEELMKAAVDPKHP